VKRRGKSPPVLVATQAAVHLMGCKAKYTASPKGRELPASERFSGTILAGGRLHEADGDIRPRSMAECKTEPGLQVCVYFIFVSAGYNFSERMETRQCLVSMEENINLHHRSSGNGSPSPGHARTPVSSRHPRSQISAKVKYSEVGGNW
jgi:hypothetical protein